MSHVIATAGPKAEGFGGLAAEVRVDVCERAAAEAAMARGSGDADGFDVEGRGGAKEGRFRAESCNRVLMTKISSVRARNVV
jgi:hypothetical protein